MGFIADICIIFILLFCILVGVRRGFIYAAAEFVGTIVSAILSAMLSTPIATWFFNLFFRESLLEKVNVSLSGATDPAGAAAVLEQFPEFVKQLLAQQGITQASLTETLAARQGNAAALIVDALSPALIALIGVLVAIVLFFLLRILVRAVASLLNKLFQLPVLGTVNQLLGGAVGLLKGIAAVWLLLAVLQAMMPAFSTDGQLAVNQFLQSASVAKFFQAFNPFSALF